MRFKLDNILTNIYIFINIDCSKSPYCFCFKISFLSVRKYNKIFKYIKIQNEFYNCNALKHLGNQIYTFFFFFIRKVVVSTPSYFSGEIVLLTFFFLPDFTYLYFYINLLPGSRWRDISSGSFCILVCSLQIGDRIISTYHCKYFSLNILESMG